MIDLLFAVTVFVAAHMVPAAKPVRAALVGGLGQTPYLVLYSLVSLALLAWVVRAYFAAPYVEMWPGTDGVRWLAAAVMAPACVLITAGIASPNPFSLGLGGKGFDAARPGIVGVTRHPVIWGLALWAAAHLAANGDAASVILFGLLLALALAGPKSLDAKRRAGMGEDAFSALAAETATTGVIAALGQTGFWRIGGGKSQHGCY